VTAVAVAAYITGAYWFTASTSFANPAVTLARALTDTFAGIRPVDGPGLLSPSCWRWDWRCRGCAALPFPGAELAGVSAQEGRQATLVGAPFLANLILDRQTGGGHRVG
jgi:hypothetical protein